MKKIISSFFLATLIFAVPGCLKDKGFENHEYGINDPDDSPVGVGFPLANGKNSVGLDISTTAQAISDVLVVKVLSGKSASSDVHIKLAVNSTIVTDYNTANGTTMAVLPTTGFSVPLDITIPAGSQLVKIPVNIPSTATLDPTKTYGLGLTISSVDAGYTVAANMKNLLIEIGLKNKYDGKYTLKGQFFHPTSAPGYPTFTTNQIEMITSGPNSVKMYCKITGLVDFLHPWVTATGAAFTAFGLQSPEYTINPTTNAVTVQNVYVGAATFYTMGKGFNNAGYNSRYDPATKTIYACFGYNNPGGNFDVTQTRMWIDTLIRTGPR